MHGNRILNRGAAAVVVIVVCLFISARAADEDEYKDNRERSKIGKPRNVDVDIVNATSIDVRWQKPRGSKECPVERYLIRLKSDGARRSKVWKIDGARTSLTLHILLEGTTYYIRVVAMSCEGRRSPTRWVRIRTEQWRKHVSGKSVPSTREIKATIRPAPLEEVPMDDEYEVLSGNETVAPGKPTYVRTRTFPDSVFVMWRPPDTRDILVRGYMVGYGEGVPDVNWQYVDATRRNVTIKNLKPATQYVISLRAFNNFGKGDVVYDLIYTREKPGPNVGPISAPSNVRAKVLSPTTVWLQWTDPSLGRHQQITDSRYYNVHYQAMPHGKTLSVIVKALHVVLYDLTPGTRYAFKVRVIKDSHSSGFSVHAVNKTFETAPTSAPRDIEIIHTPSNNSKMSVRIVWKSPRQPNGQISGYLIFYTWNPELPPSRWMVEGVVPEKGLTQSSLISKLDTNTTYYFQLQARNKQGYGPMSDTLPYTTLEEGKQNMDEDVGQMMVEPKAEPEAGDENEADEEEVVEMDDDDDDVDDEGFDDDEDDYIKGDYNGYGDNYDDEYLDQIYDLPVADHLKADADGDVSSIKKKREQGFLTQDANGEPIDDENGHDKLKVKFSSQVKHHVTAVVTWPDPCTSGGENAAAATVVGYIFRYYESTEDHITNPVSHNLAQNFIMLDNLDPAADYGYQVKYIYDNNAESQWSEEEKLDAQVKGKN